MDLNVSYNLSRGLTYYVKTQFYWIPEGTKDIAK